MWQYAIVEIKVEIRGFDQAKLKSAPKTWQKNSFNPILTSPAIFADEDGMGAIPWSEYETGMEILLQAVLSILFKVNFKFEVFIKQK